MAKLHVSRKSSHQSTPLIYEKMVDYRKIVVSQFSTDRIEEDIEKIVSQCSEKEGSGYQQVIVAPFLLEIFSPEEKPILSWVYELRKRQIY